MIVTTRATAAALAATFIIVLFSLLTGFVFQQSLTIGNWNLIIIGMDFRKSQKAMAIAAIFNKRRLQRRFNPRDFG